jgi:hypothetical protein
VHRAHGRATGRRFWPFEHSRQPDELYDSEISLLEQLNYDLELAGAALAGRDARQLSRPATLTRLGTFFVSDFIDTLAERIRASRWPLEPEQLPRIRTMLSTFSEYLSA